MKFAGIQKINTELRKVTATKLKITNNCDINIEDEEIVDWRGAVNVELGFKQTKNNKKDCTFHARYQIPVMADCDLEIEAEMVGKIIFNDSFDIDNSDESKKAQIIEKILIPSAIKEIDNLLAPLFKSMQIKYRNLPLPKNIDDSHVC